MRIRLCVTAVAATLLACSDTGIDSRIDPTETESQPPRAAFTMRDGSNTASDGATLSLSVRRGQKADVLLDASSSTAPGSTISAVEWRINGEIMSRSTTLKAPLAAATTPYQVELLITNSANASARATGTISVSEIIPTPLISAILPTLPRVATSEQLVVLSGAGFIPESRVTFTSPSGSEISMTPTPDQIFDESTMSLRLTLPTVGTWSVQVMNPGGVRSNTFAFTVAPEAVPDPAPRSDP